MDRRADIAAQKAEDEALEWLVDLEELSEAEEQRFYFERKNRSILVPPVRR